MDIAVAPSNPNVVYAAGYEGSGSSAKGRVFRSDNAGNNWTEVTNNLNSLIAGQWTIDAVMVQSNNSHNVFVGTNYGVFMSNNGGGSWQATGLTSYITALVYDPATTFIFAATSWEGVFYSEDQGITWKPLNNNGLISLYILKLDLDHTNNVLYLSAYRQGIWRLSLVGLKTGVTCRWNLYE